jgi:hypothetical protein
MVKGSSLVLDEALFVADINPTSIGSGPLSNLQIGIRATANTAAVLRACTALAAINLLRIYQSGLKTEMSGQDLLAYNVLALNCVPLDTDSGSAQYNPTEIGGLTLPLNLPSGKTALIQFVYASQATVASPYLAVYAETLQTLSSSLIGILRRPITPTTTGSYGNKTSLSMDNAKLKGLLIYSTTIPTTTAQLFSCHKIRISGKGLAMLEFNIFNLGERGALRSGSAYIDAIVDHYRYIEFEEPLDANDLIADIYADDTNVVTLLPVYIFA